MPTDAERSPVPHATIALRFLSGSGLGQCHYVTGDCVTVGTDPTCDLRIAAGDCDTGQRCCVQILTSPSGWYLNNLGSSTVAINHSIAAGETRLKSGDVIRLSLAGPDMMFSVVAEEDRRSLAGRPIVADRDPLPPTSGPAPPEMQRAASDKSRTPLHLGAGVVALALVSLMVVALALIVSAMRSRTMPAEEEAAAKDSATKAVAVATLSVQSIPEQLVDKGRRWELDLSEYVSPAQPDAYQFRPVGHLPLGMQLDAESGRVSWTPGESQAPGSYAVEFEVRSKAADAVQTAAFTLQVRAVDTPPAAAPPDPKPVVRQPPADPEPGVQQPPPPTTQWADALYLLVIEEPMSGTVFPFAVGFAVRDDLLLTSGVVVQELAQARDKGRAVFAINCVSQDQADVTALYLHPDFLSLQDRPEEQLYRDIGAVQLSDGKHSVAPLARAADATSFEQGAPLECVTPEFEAEPLTKFDNIAPSRHAAKIYMVTRGGGAGLPPESRPRLLALIGTLPKNAYGSPIIDARGQVVAVYVEKADLSDNKSLAGLADRYHYALCLDAVAGLLEGDGLDAWRLKPRTAAQDGPSERP